MPRPSAVRPSAPPATTPRRSRATGRVTLADVARMAQVSPITVSRALRGERQVDPELVERVRRAAGALGYVPDPAARALASRTSRHVAVLVPMLSNALFVDLLEAAQSTLHAAGHQTLIGITHYDAVQEEQLLRELLTHRPAGLLLTAGDHAEPTRALIRDAGVPWVRMMELPDTAPAAMAPAGASVGFSQHDAALALTRHLIAQGRRRIAFGAAQMDRRTLQRMEGWRAGLEEAGLWDPLLAWREPAASSWALGAQMFERILAYAPVDGRPPVDAIFFCNDDLAQGALLAALRLGVSVPQRVAVAGFNDLDGSDQMLPPLTTVHTPRREIGRRAAEALLQLMAGREPPAAAIDVGYALKVRGSG